MKANLRALTTREWEVLNHLANGQRNHGIANELGISPRTVQKHLQRIYAKLGVKGRTAAALYVVRAAAKKD